MALCHHRRCWEVGEGVSNWSKGDRMKGEAYYRGGVVGGEGLYGGTPLVIKGTPLLRSQVVINMASLTICSLLISINRKLLYYYNVVFMYYLNTTLSPLYLVILTILSVTPISSHHCLLHE